MWPISLKHAALNYFPLLTHLLLNQIVDRKSEEFLGERGDVRKRGYFVGNDMGGF